MNKRKLYYLLFLVTLFSCSVTSIITVAEEIGSTDESLLIKDKTLESSETIESSSSLEENELKSFSNSIEETELPTKDEKSINLEQGQAVEEYQQKIYRKNWDIWNKPYEEGAVSLSKSTSFYQSIVLVTREEKKGNSIYALISIQSGVDLKPIGWINKAGIGNVDLGNSVEPYEQKIYKKNWNIWDQPYVSGAEAVANSTDYYEKIVTVTRELIVNGVEYVYIGEKVNKELKPIGWINKNGIGSVDPLFSKEGILVPNTYKFITKNNWNIWNEPYQENSKVVKNTKEYLNEKVLFTRRAKTSSGTYVKVWAFRDGGYKYVGWLNESGLSNSVPPINQMSGESISNKYGEILKTNWSIWERPYKPGTKAVANTTDYRNKTLLFTRRTKTNYGMYYKMWAKTNGKYEFVGWVKDSGTTILDRQEYRKKVSVPMKKISKWNWTLWDKPYVYGVKPKNNTSNFYGQNVQIVSEAKTNYGTYYEIKSYGKNIGWIKSNGLSNLGNEVIVPLIQANQINTAGYAPSGCAACAAYTVLHSKNHAMNKNLIWFYNNLPQHPTNPDLGQIGNPWTYNDFRAVISPIGLNNFIRSLGGNSQNITGQSMSYVKKELSLGNPVLFWGRVGLSDTSNSLTTHVMIFTGYKDGYYLVQDPAYANSNYRRWFSEQRVNNYLSVKGKKMVVVR